MTTTVTNDVVSAAPWSIVATEAPATIAAIAAPSTAALTLMMVGATRVPHTVAVGLHRRRGRRRVVEHHGHLAVPVTTTTTTTHATIAVVMVVALVAEEELICAACSLGSGSNGQTLLHQREIKTQASISSRCVSASRGR